ncbi:NACHT, LRR and PYD domains-containing 14-like, partial [Paramuricea clavata]
SWTSENGKFSCSVDAKSTATYKRQVDQACFARYDQAYNSPVPLYGFVPLSIGLPVLVSVIYSLIVRIRVDEIESRHERQTDGEAENHGQDRKTVNVFYCYFVHLVVRALFGIILTVLQYTYFYPNGFDFKFSCNLPTTDQIRSNINTPKNASRKLNSTSVKCENATASGKWVSGVFVSATNGIVASVILVEVIYLLPRLPMFNRHSGWNCDSEFVVDYFLGKQYVSGERQPLRSIENNPPPCSIQAYSTQDSVTQACSTVNNSIQESRNQDCSSQDYSNQDANAHDGCSTVDNNIQDCGSQDCSYQDYSTPDATTRGCSTVDNNIQDSRTKDSINFYKEQVLNRSRAPDIIYGPNADINDLYIDVVIHTERAKHKFTKNMKRHEIYDVYMKVPPTSIRLEKIKDLFQPNEDTKGNFPRSILAIGRPGIGKTILTEKILRDWADGIDNYYSDKIAFFFKFRWFNNKNLENISLKTFLQFGTELSDEKFESIYHEIVKEPQRAILIFDGLDEFHGNPINCLDQSRMIPNDPKTCMSVMNLFVKLVLGHMLKEATVLVTSRPTADHFYSRLDFDRNVEIIGFTSEKIEEYVTKFCDNNNTSNLKPKIWNHIESSTELLNLCYIPVNSFIVCVTLSGCLSDPEYDGCALPTTLTELYQRAINHFEKHHQRNEGGNSTAQEALKELKRLAFLGMENVQLVFEQESFDEQMKKSGLVNCLSNPIFPLQTQFCFIHLTIQEFLAALHVTETLAPPEIKKFISDHVGSGKWHLVLQFLAGLLGKKIKKFDTEYKNCVWAFPENLLKETYGKIILDYNEVFMMKFLREVDDEEITEKVCETTSLNDVVNVSGSKYKCSLSEMAAVIFVCKHMKKLAIFKLDANNADCLSEVLELLRKRCLKQLYLSGNNRSPKHHNIVEMQQVFSALMELNCTLEHKETELTLLQLSGFRMTTEDLSTMCNFFRNGHASQLECLDLSRNEINSDDISKLRKAHNNGHCPNLTDLVLSGNNFGDEGASVLWDTLIKWFPKLNRLDVNKCKFTDQCIPKLVKALQDECCQLTVLLLLDNAIGDKGACMFFEDALTNEHCKLTKLDLTRCKLTGQCIPSLCKALQDEHCQLTSLSLSSKGETCIGDEGACMLFKDALTNEHCKLTELDLDECSLTDQCIPSLCNTLQDERCQLTVLSLGRNCISDVGACMLFEDALTNEHCKFTELDFTHCVLTDRCIPSLCKALQDEHCQLTSLSLSSNDIGDEGVCMLFKDAPTNEHCKLTELNITGCLLTDQCIPSLSEALQDEHCVLTKLWIIGDFTKKDKKLLRDIENYETCKARGLIIDI